MSEQPADPAPSRLGLLALVPLALFGLALWAYVSGALPLTAHVDWIPSLGISFGVHVDALSMLLVLLITGIGALVFVYAAGYSAGDPGRARLFGFLFAFMVAMLGCVTTDDLFVLFLFWEITSVLSFLLVGFKFGKEENRQSAQQALMITAGGGLALLAGGILLSRVAGTSSIQQLIATAPSWVDEPEVSGALICIFAGAFTKSAQVPFHFWLPGAMAAPTPVSTYLHSATMVKLGVYLLARLHPAFGELTLWQLTLVIVGAASSVWPMVLVFRERDLKRILAWSTVSALGTLVLLIGLPGPGAATVTAAFLLAHALYKAPLFFAVGNVDHATGTRILDEIGGLGGRMRFTAAAAWMAGLSMAGVPLSFGYVAKDVIKIAKSDTDIFQWVTYASVFVSAASIAAAGVATVRVFWRRNTTRPAHAKEGPPTTWFPPLLLASLGMALGLFPGLVDPLLSDAAHAMGPAASLQGLRSDETASYVALGVTVVLGVSIFFAWDRIHRRQVRLPSPRALQASGWYAGMMKGIRRVASVATRSLSGGRLPVYVGTILAFALLAAGLLLARGGPTSAWPGFAFEADASSVVAAGALVFLVAASIGVCVVRDRFLMLLVSGLVGFSSALLFLALGAPDVAFTQLTVEVAFVVVLAALLLRVRRLSLGEPAPSPRGHRLLRAALALALGSTVAALVLYGSRFSPDPALTEFFATRSVPEAYGRNVVNVILVDYRAVDTLGEIIVVTLTFLASLPLLRLLRRQRRAPRPPGETGLSDRAVMLDVAVRGIYPVMLVAAAVVLLRGHNEPGGGFIGGMIAVAATAALAVARGANAALERMPFGPQRLAVGSALLSLASGLPALFLGEPYMTHLWTTVPLGFTEYKLSTVLAFDLGVFGAVWGALGGLAARMIGLDERTTGPAATERPLEPERAETDPATTDTAAIDTAAIDPVPTTRPAESRS